MSGKAEIKLVIAFDVALIVATAFVLYLAYY
jgi:hypothetical protein